MNFVLSFLIYIFYVSGPRKSVSKAPSAEDKINGLASTLSDYEAKIQGGII